MNFRGKSENVMFLHSLRLSYMQKIRKFYRTVFRERGGRQKDRQKDRDGPEFKGPPDAIAKPSDQKLLVVETTIKATLGKYKITIIFISLLVFQQTPAKKS